jgi:predicted permease
VDYLESLLTLFTEKLLPVFLTIGTGWVLQRCLHLDLRSLNRINIYVFVPGLLLAKLLEAEMQWGALVSVLGLYCLSVTLVATGGFLLAGLSPPTRAHRSLITLAGTFGNAGNYGIPLMALVFGPAGVVVQSIILMANNVLSYTLGLYLVSGTASPRRALAAILRVPIPYVLVIAGALQATDTALPGAVMTYIGYLGDGLIPVALLTLGAQLADANLRQRRGAVTLATAQKLILAPAVMAGVVFLGARAGIIEWGGLYANVLILASALPSAVNTVIIALEFSDNAEVPAGTVLVATLLSALSVPVVLSLLGV